MYERVSRLADGLCRAVEILCNAMLAVMTAIIAMLIVSRNLLNFSFPWSEELTRFLLVWLSMLGAAVLLRRDDHIRLELLTDYLSPRMRIGLSLALRLLVLVFLVILLQQSWLTADARAVTHAPASGISMRVPYLALPAGAALMIFVTLVNLWGDMLRLLGRRPLDEAR
mgnify:CR=1 FL=1